MDTQGNTYAIYRIRVALRELCDEDGIVSISLTDIGLMVGASQTTAGRCMSRLVKLGELEVVDPFGRAKVYRVANAPGTPALKREPHASSGQRKVLRALKDMGAEDHAVEASMHALAKESGVSVPTAVRAVSFWSERGRLSVERSLDESGRIMPNKYRLEKQEGGKPDGDEEG